MINYFFAGYPMGLIVSRHGGMPGAWPRDGMSKQQYMGIMGFSKKVAVFDGLLFESGFK